MACHISQISINKYEMIYQREENEIKLQSEKPGFDLNKFLLGGQAKIEAELKEEFQEFVQFCIKKCDDNPLSEYGGAIKQQWIRNKERSRQDGQTNFDAVRQRLKDCISNLLDSSPSLTVDVRRELSSALQALGKSGGTKFEIKQRLNLASRSMGNHLHLFEKKDQQMLRGVIDLMPRTSAPIHYSQAYANAQFSSSNPQLSGRRVSQVLPEEIPPITLEPKSGGYFVSESTRTHMAHEMGGNFYPTKFKYGEVPAGRDVDSPTRPRYDKNIQPSQREDQSERGQVRFTSFPIDHFTQQPTSPFVYPGSDSGKKKSQSKAASGFVYPGAKQL